MLSHSFAKYASSMAIVPVTLFSAKSIILIFVLTSISKGMVPVSKLEWAKTSSWARSSTTEEGMVPQREVISNTIPLRVRPGYHIVEGIVPVRWFLPRPTASSVSIWNIYRGIVLCSPISRILSVPSWDRPPREEGMVPMMSLFFQAQAP